MNGPEPKLRGGKPRRPLVTGVAALVAAVLAAASAAPGCGSERPPAADGDGTHVGPPGVSNGPCSPEGGTQACHQVIGQHEGYLDCFVGTQTCQGGVWSACGGGSISSRYMPDLVLSSPADTLRPLVMNPPAVGATVAGTLCASDPCNPYCLAFNATPNAGVPIVPAASIQNVPPSGTAICSPHETALGVGCATNKNRDCYQDTHCDLATNKCVWNIATTQYTDAACIGFDLMMNAWCPPVGALPATFTVCNRGTVALAAVAGATTNLNVFVPKGAGGGPSGMSSNCLTPLQRPTVGVQVEYVQALAADLAPGACTTIPSSGSNGNRSGFVYATRQLTTSTTSGNGVTPIAYATTVAHGLKTGDTVTITGITGNTNANVSIKTITVTGANTFTVAGVTGNGAYGGVGSINAFLAECDVGTNGGCFNNESSAKDNGSCSTCGPAGGAPITVTPAAYQMVCPVGTSGVWGYLTYDITSGTGDVKFDIKTAPDVAGAPGAYTAYTTVADPQVIVTDPWVRTMANPVDLKVMLGRPAFTNPWLQIMITNTPSGAGPYPAINSWALGYSCVPSE
jgi:hypothetical protein